MPTGRGAAHESQATIQQFLEGDAGACQNAHALTLPGRCAAAVKAQRGLDHGAPACGATSSASWASG